MQNWTQAVYHKLVFLLSSYQDCWSFWLECKVKHVSSTMIISWLRAAIGKQSRTIQRGNAHKILNTISAFEPCIVFLADNWADLAASSYNVNRDSGPSYLILYISLPNQAQYYNGPPKQQEACNSTGRAPVPTVAGSSTDGVCSVCFLTADISILFQFCVKTQPVYDPQSLYLP